MLSLIHSQKSWNKALASIDPYDCYHTHEYHWITRKDNEEVFLLNYENSNTRIVIPFIKRPIEGTPYFDLTSVYGYAGPVFKKGTSYQDIRKFQEEFRCFLKRENIVTVFSRLHPYLPDQLTILEGLGNVVELGPVVNINLNEDVDLQRSAFSKTTKRYLNKARRHFYVDYGNSEYDMIQFMELYNATMDRLDAKDRYYFEKDYFLGFLNSVEFRTDFIFAKTLDGDKVASAAMILKTKNMVQYHLSGTNEDYLKLSPLRLLIDEARIQAAKENFDYFNLGGGVGSEEDSLLRFKTSFSKDIRPFRIWKYVANREVYEKLCTYVGIKNVPKEETQYEGFFHCIGQRIIEREHTSLLPTIGICSSGL